MGLAQIESLPATAEEFASWSFAHMSHHRDIIRVIGETKNKRLDEYFIDNFSPETTDDTNWLYLHQVMHQQMDSALSIQGYALNTLDWQDDSSVASWFNQHFDEHAQAAQILGIA